MKRTKLELRVAFRVSCRTPAMGGLGCARQERELLRVRSRERERVKPGEAWGRARVMRTLHGGHDSRYDARGLWGAGDG